MELKVLNKEGKETGRTVVLNDEVFGIEPNDHVIYLAVKQWPWHHAHSVVAFVLVFTPQLLRNLILLCVRWHVYV